MVDEDVNILSLLTSALHEGEWSVSGSGRITLGEGVPFTHWIECWVDSKFGLEEWRREEKNFSVFSHQSFKL
jgi:hypothetical protein